MADEGELEFPGQLKRRIMRQLEKAVVASSSQETFIREKRH